MQKLHFPPHLRAFLLAVALVAGCSKPQPQPKQPPAPKPDFLAANIDTSVNPGDDFFQYAVGSWLKKNPIPATESAWGIGNLVRDDIYVQLRTINENAVKSNAAAGTDEQKIGDFWATAMDEAKAEQLRLTPLKPELDRIDAIQNTQDAINEAFELQHIGIDAFFGFYVGQDEKQSDVISVHLQQGGLGLPDRDFYFNPDAGFAKYRAEYVSHLSNMLKLLGNDEATAKASATKIMEFETALAKTSRKLEDLRDPVKNYNRMTVAEVRQRHTPSIDWDSKLGGWNLHPSYLVVGQPEFFTGVEALLKKTPAPVLRDYLKFHLVSEFASFLNKDIDAEHFNFYHRVLSGQKEPRPRWKRVLDSETGPMGMVVGRIFVKEYFPESEKKRYTDLVEAIRTTYSERIDELDWMSAETKAKAHQKLAAVTKKVGYPDKWKDYSGLTIGKASYCDNMM